MLPLERLIHHGEKLLDELLKFTSAADSTLRQFFRAHPQLGATERGVLAEAAFTVLRRQLEFKHLAASGSGTLLRQLALLGLRHAPGAQQRWSFSAVIPAAEAAWLERAAELAQTLPAELQLNLPQWLQTSLSKHCDQQALAQLALALQSPAPLDVRVNSLKARRSEVLAALQEAQLEAAATPFAPLGIRLVGKPNLHTLAAFEKGWFEVQDEGSQLVCHLMAPKRGQLVVDFCAGAGGKTLALGALMRSTGHVYAFDVAGERLEKLKVRLAKSGLSNVRPMLLDSEHDLKLQRLAGKIDCVLVDAPCSGLGTLRRNPDLKWRQTPASVAEFTCKQASILANAAQLVKPGGRLVYATCSFLETENEAIVADFLKQHSQFKVLSAADALAKQKINLNTGDYLSLWPHQHGTDGFFAALLERVI